MKGVAAFLWDFVVGDDWVGAAGVTVLLAVTAALAHGAGVSAWWLLPPGVALTLAATLRRAVRAAVRAAAHGAVAAAPPRTLDQGRTTTSPTPPP